MDQDETPLLIRHPLQHQLKAPFKDDLQSVSRPFEMAELDTNTDSGSDTDLDTEIQECVNGQEECEEGMASEDDLPSTQQVDPRPLAGLIAFVDVRSGTDSCENRRDAIAHQLDILGATVTQRLTKDVTHVVFKDGKQTTREKAEKKGIYLVSPLWLDACKRANDRISEAKYPILCKDGSDSPVVLGRIKRMKSMQPKPLMEEITKSLERSRKRQRTERRISSPRKSLKTDSDRANPDDVLSSEDEEDSFELPEIKLPGTPLSKSGEGGCVVVTPESVISGIDKGSSKQKSKSELTPSSSGKGSSKKKSKNVPTPITGKGSVNTKTQKTPTAVSGKGSSVEKPLNEVSGMTGKGSPKKENQVSKKASDSGRKTKKRYSAKENVNIHPSAVVATSTHPPLQSITNNTSAEDSDGKELKPKKRKARGHRTSFEKPLPNLVLTSVKTSDQETVHSIVDKLGYFKIAKTVCETTSHVVCGSPRRTVNILSATLNGCWILSLDWVLKSLERGCWVTEDPYEMSSSFPAARHYRIERMTSFTGHCPALFKGCGSVFVSSGSAPPTEQLENLLALGGGKVTTSHRKADVCVGCRSWSNDVQSVSEQWILDSISEHKLLPVEDYLLDSALRRAVSPEL